MCSELLNHKQKGRSAARAGSAVHERPRSSAGRHWPGHDRVQVQV